MTYQYQAPRITTNLMPIPPQSVARLVRYDRRTRPWREEIGRVFRIGYYSRMDGLDCIWLVNDEGEYEQTLDHECLYRFFDVIHFAKDTNWYGHKRSLIPAIRPADLAVSKTKKPKTRVMRNAQPVRVRKKELRARS